VEQAYILLGKDALPTGIVRLLYSGSFLHRERDSNTYTMHGLLKSFLGKELKGLHPDEIRGMQKLAAPKEQDAKLLGIAQGVFPEAEQHHFLLPQVYFHLFIAIAHHRLGRWRRHWTALFPLHCQMAFIFLLPNTSRCFRLC